MPTTCAPVAPQMHPSGEQASAKELKIIGWEAWTRTRIARVRVWSPTNWTTSQRGGTKRNRGKPGSRGSYDSTILI
jgi:hypothetical protein